jgi:hypothetical protein
MLSTAENNHKKFVPADRRSGAEWKRGIARKQTGLRRVAENHGWVEVAERPSVWPDRAAENQMLMPQLPGVRLVISNTAASQ